MPESAANSGFTYRAFISYSHRDKGWCDWLHKALETYRVPSRLIGKVTAHGTIPRRLNPVFRDREELASATDLGRKVNAALGQSENLVVICSPASATSRWVNEEVLAYKRMGRGDRIFCLIVDGEPNATDIPGRESEECFCPALRFATNADGQPIAERTEPIAADARPGKDGKANAKLKLIAGMLDVGFDALKQREQRRQLQRMTAITAMAVCVMAVTVVLAIFALISRHDAVIAQHKAIVAQQAAERRQKQAENLVGFMLGDLSDKLDQVHRLDILQAVDDKAMAYFNSLPAADATDAALAMRVTALEKIGSVRMDQGHVPEALLAYKAASTLARELVRRVPGDVAREAAYADSLKWVGQAYWYQGDLSHALKNYLAAIVLLEKAHAAKPADDDLTFKLATARNDAGHVRESLGELAAAQHEYESYLAIFQSLHRREPANPKWQTYRADAWNNLGKIALEQGHLDTSIADYRTDQQIKATLAGGDAQDHRAQEYLLVSNAILGRTLALCGQLEVALRFTNDAVNSADALAAIDPADADNQEYVALYSQQLGGLLRQDGQLNAAATADAKATEIFARLVAKDATDKDWQQEYAQARIETARLKLQQLDINGAQALADAALQTLDAMRKKNGADRALALLDAQARLILGEIAAKRADTVVARLAWNQARDAVTPILDASNDPNALAIAATASLLLDEKARSTPLLSTLATMGYRTPDFDALLSAKHVAYEVNPDVTRRITTVIELPATVKANH